MNRLAAMQDWPLFWHAGGDRRPRAARSRSADGITTNGSLPPSSSTVFLTSSPAIAATERPAGSLPVSVAARDPRVAQDVLDRARADQQGLEAALGEAGAAEQVLEVERGLRHVRGVLEQPDVARHQRGRGEADRPARAGSSTA